MKKTFSKTIGLAFTVVISAFLTISCVPNGPVKYIPDVSDLSASVDIVRFEKELFALDTTNISQALEKLKEKHQEFSELYFNEILGVAKNGELETNLKAILAVPEVRQIADTVAKVYPNLDKFKLEIESMQKYCQHYLGNNFIPIKKAYSFISMYNYGVFVIDSVAGIGLDFFLGENHPAYLQLESLRHQYLRRTLTPEHVLSKLAFSMAEDIVNGASKMKNNYLIDHMLQEGKKFYIVASVLPELPDSVVYSFSNFQILYCQRGEQGLYQHLAKEELLYSSHFEKFRKYVTAGPFNPQVELPGNSGSWLGAQIVTQYAARLRKEFKGSYPTLNARQIDQMVMEKVLFENDPQKFLQRYKPQKIR